MDINNLLNPSTMEGAIFASIIAGGILTLSGIGVSKVYKKMRNNQNSKNKQKGDNNTNIQNVNINIGERK